MSNLISKITLCNVPLEPLHQLDFKDLEAQKEYFDSKAIFTYPKCKYTPRTGKIYVKGYVDDLNKCNYGYYTNSYNGTEKTYFFFIVRKNLLARQTTELVIQLDVYQTWMFDIKFNPCFIEREIVETDNQYTNTYPENFELGDYIFKDVKTIDELEGDVGFFIGVTDSENDYIGGKFGALYSGYKLRYFAHDDTDSLTSYIRDLCNEGKADCIAFIFSFPEKILKTDFYGWKSGDYIDNFPEKCWTYDGILDYPEKFEFNGYSYTPKNKKCYNYPFNFVTITNPNGDNIILKWENTNDFTDKGTPRLAYNIEGILTPNPKFQLVPLNYTGRKRSYEDGIFCTGWGLCSWNNDNFANWYANHKHSLSNQSILAHNNYNTSLAIAKNNATTSYNNNSDQLNSGIATSLISAIDTNIFNGLKNGAINGINTATNYGINERNIGNDLDNAYLQARNDYSNEIKSLVSQIADATVQPNTCRGETSQDGLDIARGTCTFRIMPTQIKPEYIKQVDMFFQMYGYQVNRVGEFKLNTRKHWNYVKTVNANITGDLPFEDKQEMQNLLNSGFTVWHSEDVMFNYDQLNPKMEENING